MKNQNTIFIILGLAAAYFFLKKTVKETPKPDPNSGSATPDQPPIDPPIQYTAEDRALPNYDPKSKPTDNTAATPGNGNLAGLY